MGRCVEIMDTTLRDGQQMPSSRLMTQAKLEIAKFLLERVRVDRIEVASALTSEGEFRALKAIMDWAKVHNYDEQIEVLGFLDGDRSARWIQEAGGKVVNLLCKGSAKHSSVQLGMDVHQHSRLIKKTVDCCRHLGLRVNLYLEDWSQGMRDSWDSYLKPLLQKISCMRVERVMLADTLGVLHYAQTCRYIKQTKRILYHKKLDFHAHNDYGLAVANTLAAVSTGLVSGVHTTVIGLGERTGNASLEQVVVGIHDQTKYRTHVDEKELRSVSEMVSLFTGRDIPENAPIVGRYAFSSGCGVHDDGNRKGRIYQSRLTAERFGATFVSALSSQSGKASILECLEHDLGITSLSDDQVKTLLSRIKALNDAGKRLTSADLLDLVAEICHQPERILIRVKDINTESLFCGKSAVSATLVYEDEEVSFTAEGNGQFDAFMKGLSQWAQYAGITVPERRKFKIHVRSEKDTDAMTEAIITWRCPNGKEFQTIGASPCMVMAAIRAAIQAVNYCNQK